MARVECRGCGGVYEDVQADGLRYFHVCPPIIELADKDGKIVSRAEALVLHAAGETVQIVARERPGHRDENVVRDPITGQARAKAEGAGVREIAEVRR